MATHTDARCFTINLRGHFKITLSIDSRSYHNVSVEHNPTIITSRCVWPSDLKVSIAIEKLFNSSLPGADLCVIVEESCISNENAWIFRLSFACYRFYR